MLLPDITGPVRAVLLPHLRERAVTLREEVEAVAHNHAARGTLHSGMFIRDVYKLCAKEVDYRVDFLWLRLAQGLTHARMETYDDLLNDIRTEIAGYRESILAGIGAVLQGEERRSGMNSHRDLSSEWDHAQERVLGEASMEILRMKNREKPLTPFTVNFHGPGGVFQQGDHSVVNQQWGTQDVEMVRTLLGRIQEQIPVVEMEPPQREETIALVEDTRTELTKRRPDVATVLKALTSLREMIEGVQKLRPMYEQIGTFLRTHGLNLPGA